MRWSRRRFLTVTGAAAGFALVSPGIGRAGERSRMHVWRGVALGAEATILLHHPDGAEARRILADCVDEIARLERVFSLYRGDSALSRLNRDGALAAPPLDLVQLLGDCRHFSRLTGGAFDATVQPLWALYASHFARPGARPEGPAEEEIAQARALVDHEAVSVAPSRIAFRRPGMAATLNGIAQGYVTDRVGDMLRARGIDRVLLDLGEVRALGRHPSGRPWRVGLRDALRPDRVAGQLDLADQAVATSAPAAFRFDEGGRHHHLFDPASGRPAAEAAGVSVVAGDATTADALSTALCVMPAAKIPAVTAAFENVSVLVADSTGALTSYGARLRPRGLGARAVPVS